MYLKSTELEVKDWNHDRDKEWGNESLNSIKGDTSWLTEGPPDSQEELSSAPWIYLYLLLTNATVTQRWSWCEPGWWATHSVPHTPLSTLQPDQVCSPYWYSAPSHLPSSLSYCRPPAHGSHCRSCPPRSVLCNHSTATGCTSSHSSSRDISTRLPYTLWSSGLWCWAVWKMGTPVYPEDGCSMFLRHICTQLWSL